MGYNTVDGIVNTITGGMLNSVVGDYTTVIGGYQGQCDGDGNVIGGGYQNVIVAGDYCAISGGKDNTMNAVGYGTIGGGLENVVDATAATNLGGTSNKAQSNYAVTIGGFRNKVDSRFSTTIGGSKNTVNGRFAVAAGYRTKITGDYSAAFGLSGDSCEARNNNQMAICADKFTIVNSDGDTLDVVELFESRERHLEENAQFAKDTEFLSQTDQMNVKKSQDHAAQVEALRKRTAAMLEQLSHTDYDALLKSADALIASAQK